MLNIFKQVDSFKERIAIESNNKQFSYSYLIEQSDLIASSLLDDKPDLMEEKIGLLMNPDIEYIASLWGIWKAGGIVVPLSLSAKENELKHCISDCNIKLIISSKSCDAKQHLPNKEGLEVKHLEDFNSQVIKNLPEILPDRKAMILYTSGTTSKPKGVISTHKNVESQITALVKAWEWTKDDHIPLFLPLHHIHGIINSLSCPLYVCLLYTSPSPRDRG